MSIPKPVILDISEWQKPANINYDNLAKSVDGVIVRVQYGSRKIDNHYKTHIKELQKRKVPVGVYAWIRGTSVADMEKEATDFWNRAKEFNPTFWWLDVEEKSMNDMRAGAEAYRKKLKALGAKKVGAYIANHLYASLNLDVAKFDGIWIPTYGSSSGQYNGSNPTATTSYDIHQYTDKGNLHGINGSVDLNRIVRKGFDYFFGKASNPSGGSSSGGSKLPSLESIATDTAAGKYGNGKDREKNLDHLYPGVQAIINHRAGGSTETAVNVLVKETLKGIYGNGDDRKARLGNYWQPVQDKINKG